MADEYLANDRSLLELRERRMERIGNFIAGVGKWAFFLFISALIAHTIVIPSYLKTHSTPHLDEVKSKMIETPVGTVIIIDNPKTRLQCLKAGDTKWQCDKY